MALVKAVTVVADLHGVTPGEKRGGGTVAEGWGHSLEHNAVGEELIAVFQGRLHTVPTH